MFHGKVQLDREYSNGYDLITYLENENQVVCIIEKDGKMMIKSDLVEGEITSHNLFGCSSVCFDSKKYFGGMTCTEPPGDFNQPEFVMIIVTARPKLESEKVDNFRIVERMINDIDEVSSGMAFICSRYFNSIFQGVFLCGLSIQESIEHKNEKEDKNKETSEVSKN